MKLQILLFLLLLSAFTCFSQEKGTPINTFGKIVTDKFPSTRTFDLQYEQLGPANYSSKLFGEDLERGRFENHNRLKLAVNLPIYKSQSQRFALTGSFRYKYESFGFGPIYDANENLTPPRPTQDFHYLAAAVTATYITTLFNKPVIYNATVSVDGNQENVQRIKGFGTASLVLKRTANTTITIGLLGMIDPSSIVPIAPLFTYNHRFQDSKWDIDVIIPKSILLRRELLENGRISIGTELFTENFYLNLKTSQLNGIYELNSLSLQSGVTYEYRLDKKIISTFKAGINNVVSTRITERGERTDKYIYDNKQDAQAYFRFGISYNPF
ncbi:hypothetical protein OIU83_05260 [Flavobacterium sp. LS1R49]|uniref:Outer membrane protein beta-barrel domain-containing protein n=1 Tax=Flavobacterium shii TaxID=2987687 RepID=A0A9X2Z9W1_9FLAO|nr:hypothetical protein [Flavobacterium shii]MCV9927046.1 hypothetical protein [Flavobacterium shii]